jgi:hypothetical protein
MNTINKIQLVVNPLNHGTEVTFNVRKTKALNEKKELDKYPLYIPENLDLEKIFLNAPPPFKYHKDCFVYILHLISSIPSSNNSLNIEEVDGFIPINKILLQSRIRDYRKYINYLTEAGIIEENHQYIVGSKSSSIRFYRDYQTKIAKVFITKRTLIKSIRKFKKLTSVKTFIRNTENYDYLEKWWDNKLTINKDNSINYLQSELQIDLESTKIKYPMAKYNSRLMVIERFTNHDYLFRVDKTAGRLHTLLTQLKSELRPFLKYDGKTLVNIDIVNSQPFFSTILFDDEKILKNHILEVISLYNNKFSSDLSQPYSSMLVNFAKTNKENSDVQEYLHFVKEGKFYEFFGEKMVQMGKIPISLDPREEAKKVVFSALFSRNQALGYKDEIRLFKDNFPTVFQIFKLIKSGTNNHRTLACSLQNLEAKVILSKICKKISECHPNIPIFTIHDSITTTQENVGIINDIMSDEIEKVVGFKPILKLSAWT